MVNQPDDAKNPYDLIYDTCKAHNKHTNVMFVFALFQLYMSLDLLETDALPMYLVLSEEPTIQELDTWLDTYDAGRLSHFRTPIHYPHHGAIVNLAYDCFQFFSCISGLCYRRFIMCVMQFNNCDALWNHLVETSRQIDAHAANE